MTAKVGLIEAVFVYVLGGCVHCNCTEWRTHAGLHRLGQVALQLTDGGTLKIGEGSSEKGMDVSEKGAIADFDRNKSRVTVYCIRLYRAISNRYCVDNVVRY